jgi:hypothetical protein
MNDVQLSSVYLSFFANYHCFTFANKERNSIIQHRYDQNDIIQFKELLI